MRITRETRLLLLSASSIATALAITVGAVIWLAKRPVAGGERARQQQQRVRQLQLAEPNGEVVEAECVDVGAYDECPGSLVCEGGRCVPGDREKTLCAAGDALSRGCVCVAPMVPSGGRCTKAPPRVAACEDEAFAAALTTLIAACSRATDTGRELCTAADLENYVLNDEGVDSLLALFPDRFALHFPTDRPRPIEAETWPGGHERDEMVALIKRHRVALAAAKRVFLIARTSERGTYEYNQELAVRRTGTAARLIAEVLAQEGAIDVNGYRRRELRVALGERRPVDAGVFARTYASSFATRSSAVTDKLARQLENHAELSDAARRSLRDAINRTVFVIPVPCDEAAFSPRPGNTTSRRRG